MRDAVLPLAVDLDGTLIKNDLMQDAAAAFVAQRPLNVFRLLQWAAGGRTALKARLARHAPRPNAASLPYNAEFLAYLREQRAQGRRLVLATAAHWRHARAVAAHLGLFDEVLASAAGRGGVNLKGEAKAAALVARYGEGGFDYAGDSRADLPVWRRAKNALLVRAAPALAKLAPQAQEQAQVFDARETGAARLTVWARALRPRHWAKNLLLFAALVGGHRFGDLVAAGHAALGFLAFNCLASATYLVNDILDLPHDRRHERKRLRPLAAGHIALPPAVAVAIGLFVLAAALAAALPPLFALCAALYVVATFAYSFKLKRLLFIDVLMLSLLFTLRLLAGGAASEIYLSFYLIAFAVFLFLSLAILKRVSELTNAAEAGRAYQQSDRGILANLGVASGMLSVFVLALFIDSDVIRDRYQTPEYLWLAVPLMIYWIGRLWLLGGRGVVGSDPLLFAVRDRVSLLLGALIGLCAYLAV